MRYAVLLVRVLPRSRVLDYTPIQTRVMRLGARASMFSPCSSFSPRVFLPPSLLSLLRSQSFGDRSAIERVRRVFEAPCEFPGVISFYLTLQILPNILRTGSTVFTHRVFVETHTFHSLFSLLTSLSLSPSYTSLLVLTALARRRVRCISRLVLRREGVARRRCRASSFLVVYLSSFAKGRREPPSLLL